MRPELSFRAPAGDPTIAKPWMYGATGYSGELIAREAGERTTALEGVGLVLHCAGPFAATSAPMIEACLRSNAHYLDIRGEISVFEHAHSLAANARRANVVLCPGVGFDVVPTDCVAVALKEALPDATHLALAFDSRSGLSPGTAKTAIEGLKAGGAVRQNHAIVAVPQAFKVRRIDGGDGGKHAMTIPWGDISTAYRSTGIPNIEVYLPAPRIAVLMARGGNHMGWLWRRPRVISGLQRLVERFVKGPDAARRGQHPPAGGAYTPATLMGHDFVSRLPGSHTDHNHEKHRGGELGESARQGRDHRQRVQRARCRDRA